MQGWQSIRDVLVVGFALVMGAYEIILGGARPVVLTFLSGLLLSPIFMRVDALHRKNGGNGAGS